MAEKTGSNRFKIWGALALAVLTIVVVAQNTEAVPFRFLFWTVTASRALLLFVTLLAGFVLGLIVASRKKK